MKYEELIGKRCNWEILKIMKHDWQLKCDDRVVATLSAKKRFGRLFEGTFESVTIEIAYNRVNDNSIITNIINCETIGTIESLSRLHIEGLGALPEPAVLITAGRKYHLTLKKDLGYIISRTDGVLLASTDFNNRSTPVTSAFTLFSTDEGSINPWLLAVVGQYFAISHAYGTAV